MPYRLAAHHFKGQKAASADDLRKVFDSAVCELHQAELTAKKMKAKKNNLQYGQPIVPRARVLGLSRSGAEKLAVSNAATALAQLWKV